MFSFSFRFLQPIRSSRGGGGGGNNGGGMGGGGNNNGGGINDYDSGNYNTYGLSSSFLEGLGIQGPLHTKVFVANVSIVFFFVLSSFGWNLFEGFC